ncbi:MAG: DNA-formamidopyrimidine glycosylase family protein [Smithella sp.]
MLSSKVYDHKLVNIKNVRGRRVMTVECNSKMINILLADGNSISVHLRTTGTFLRQENAAEPKCSHWRMTFDNGNLFLIDPRRFAPVKILKRLESNSGKDIIKNCDLKFFKKIMEAGREKLNYSLWIKELYQG